jgi:glycosyltransferase involved in cell wall biosynthesis
VIESGSGASEGHAADAASMKEVRQRLVEAEAARWRSEVAANEMQREFERVAAEFERVAAEYEELLRSRAYRYVVHPLQRVFTAFGRHVETTPTPPATHPAEVDVSPLGAADDERTSPVDTGPLHYTIYGPESGQEVEDDLVVTVAGWVASDASPVARVETWVDGVYRGKARLGISSPDAVEELHRSDAQLSGFEHLVDLSGLPLEGDGATLDVWVETLAGDRYHIFSVTVLLPVDTNLLERLPSLPAGGTVRLLVFTHHLGLGGAQLYLFELLRQLSEASDFSAVVVSPADGVLRERTEALGIPVAVIGAQPVATEPRYERRQAELEEWARTAGFNAVLANTLLCYHGVDLADRLGLPAVWAIHDSLKLPHFWRVTYGSRNAADARVRARAEAAFRSAAAVVFVAHATRDLLADLGDPRRFVTIPYGIDFDEIDAFMASVSRAEARRRLDLAEDATVLICVGTIEPRKAQTVLAQAFGIVAADHPDALLAFVGARSDNFTKVLTSYVRAASLGDRVRVVSVTGDVYLWFRAADALLLPSDVESLPRTVLEAMAFSVPVVATRIFGLPEVIEDGVTGYLCEPRDVHALVDALRRFLGTSSVERERMAAEAARFVRARHGSRGYAEAYGRLLRRLVENPSELPDDALRAAAQPLVVPPVDHV